NDIAFLGAGDDTFGWDNGDGSDTVVGQGGNDTLEFNSSDASENVDISANGNGVRLTRDVGNVTMDLNDVEQIDYHALGGADTITVNEAPATGLLDLNLDLEGTGGRGDGQADAVIVNGTNGDDTIPILSADNGSRITVGAQFPSLNIIGSE